MYVIQSYVITMSKNDDLRDLKWVVVDLSGNIVVDYYNEIVKEDSIFVNDLEVIAVGCKTDENGNQYMEVVVDPYDYLSSTTLYDFYFDLPYMLDYNVQVFDDKSRSMLCEDYGMECPFRDYDYVQDVIKKVVISKDLADEFYVDIYVDTEGKL